MKRGHIVLRTARLATWAVLLAALVGCGRRPASSIPDDLAARCVVVGETSPPAPRESWSAWLDRNLKKAPRFSPDQLEQAIGVCLASDLALVLAAPAATPEATEMLRDFVARGARLVLLGRAHARSSGDQPSLLEATGHAEKTFSMTTGVFRTVAEGLTVEVPPLAVESPVPPPKGLGGERAAHARWIPAVEAAGSSGSFMAWPGSVFLKPQLDSGYSICAWLGMDPAPADGEELAPLVAAVLREATREVYLHQCGLERHSAPANTPLQATARMIDRRARNVGPLRLVVAWVDPNGQEIRRHVSPPLDTPALTTALNIGLAPEPATGHAELYQLRIMARDRGDQITHDMAEQTIKVFPRNPKPPVMDPVTVQGGLLVQGRRPLFMLGANYWPRLSQRDEASPAPGHWLDPERFDPREVTSDLDLMEAIGINAIAIEYTDISQAPQLVYLLDELRRRSMWASVYLPALHPIDVRLEEGMRMLEAIDPRQWPELFAFELARGLAIHSRPERRRLDPAWADWLDEHFNSWSEAEQKLGVTLWRERGKVAGPPDNQIRQGPHRDPAVALYYIFLRDYVSRRMGYVRQALRQRGYPTLLTARSAFGWPGGTPPAGALDALDISTGSLHQDFLSPDAWTIHPLDNVHADGHLLAAYVRGVGGGKPVVWTAYGQPVGTEPNPQTLQRQSEVYKHYLDLFTREASSGAFAWRYPCGMGSLNDEDWGIMNYSGTWRPVENVFRSTRLKLRQTMVKPPKPVRRPAPLMTSASQWRSEQAARSGLFGLSGDAGEATEFIPPGAELDSASVLDPNMMQRWSEIDGLTMMNAEWGQITVGNNPQDRAPGDNVRTYAGRPLQFELLNSGTVRWIDTPDRRAGSVWLRISQPGHADEWIAAQPSGAPRRYTVRWTAREPGLWEIQPYLIGYGKFGERLRLEVTTPPRLF